MGVFARLRDKRHEDIGISGTTVELVTSEDEVVVGGGSWVEGSWRAVVVAVFVRREAHEYRRTVLGRVWIILPERDYAL